MLYEGSDCIHYSIVSLRSMFKVTIKALKKLFVYIICIGLLDISTDNTALLIEGKNVVQP